MAVNVPQFVESHMVPEIKKRTEELNSLKIIAKDRRMELQEQKLQIETKNENMLKLLVDQSNELDDRIKDHKQKLEETKKKCEEQIVQAKIDLDKEFREFNQILIDNKKKFHHLRFNLQEKKEVDETRKAMLDQEQRLKAELKITSKECKEKIEIFEREEYQKRTNFKLEASKNLQIQIQEAQVNIQEEKNTTLIEAEREVHRLTKKVTGLQKIVAGLRNRNDKLVEESKDLEMQLMEAKLVTQLTKPDEKKDEIAQLVQQRDSLEDKKLKLKTQPEAENRRLSNTHVVFMKKQENELNGFRKLNQMKSKELREIRNFAFKVVEQRKTLVSFLNDTIAILQKEIASFVDQKSLPFRTSPLILCHMDFESPDGIITLVKDPHHNLSNLTEQLRYFEYIQSKFTGIPQPQQIDDVL